MTSEKRNICIIGIGGIGSTFAFQLAQAGHRVTVVARGKRLEQLQRDRAIVKSDGGSAAVQLAPEFDTAIAWDLVLVTVLAHQVDVLLPALAASRAQRVMFMFNTFKSLAPLREAVGAERFSFGFPAILATLDEAKLTTMIVTRGQITTVTDAALARLFTEAGIDSVVEADIESWLRTHAAMVVPFMVTVGKAYQRQAGISWAEAALGARAMQEGFELVKRLGHPLIPAPMAFLGRLPQASLALLLWLSSRMAHLRKNGAVGFRESDALIDEMLAVAGRPLPALQAIRS